jgi:hypothetical protein
MKKFLFIIFFFIIFFGWEVWLANYHANEIYDFQTSETAQTVASDSFCSATCSGKKKNDENEKEA